MRKGETLPWTVEREETLMLLSLDQLRDVGGCRIWTGSKRPNGYGRIWYNGRSINAHRVFYKWRFGYFPRLNGDHTCTVRACVWCIDDVTQKENIRRYLDARVTCRKGHELNGKRRCVLCRRASTKKHKDAHKVGINAKAVPRKKAWRQRRRDAGLRAP